MRIKVEYISFESSIYFHFYLNPLKMNKYSLHFAENLNIIIDLCVSKNFVQISTIVSTDVEMLSKFFFQMVMLCLEKKTKSQSISYKNNKIVIKMQKLGSQLTLINYWYYINQIRL